MYYFCSFNVILIFVLLYVAFNCNNVKKLIVLLLFLCNMIMMFNIDNIVDYNTKEYTYYISYDITKNDLNVVDDSRYFLIRKDTISHYNFKDITIYDLYYDENKVLSTTNKKEILYYFNKYENMR